MNKKLQLSMILIIILSMSFSACSRATPVAQGPTQPPLPSPTPTLAKPISLSWPDYLAGLSTDTYDSISADALGAATASISDKPFILDVREPSEIQANGFIPSSYDIPVKDVLNNLNKLPPINRSIVIYDQTGERSAMVTAALRILGYTNVLGLKGGLIAWQNAARNINQGTQPASPYTETPGVNADQLKSLQDFFTNMPDTYYLVAPKDLNTQVTGSSAPVIIDVDTASEFKNGSIQGAVNIPINTLLKDTSKLPSDKTAAVVLVDRNGFRAGIGLIALRLNGYTNVTALQGGLTAWTLAGFSTK